jgi:anti-sigma B factor antagonist
MSDVSEELVVDVLTQSGGATVAVRGEIDAHTCARLQEGIDAAVASFTSGSGHVVVDLEGVAFIDSSGLRVLVNAANGLEETGGDLRLRNPSPTVRRLLQVTGLDEHFLER